MTCSRIQNRDCYQKVFAGNQVPVATTITAIFWATVCVSAFFFLPGAPRIPVISSTPFFSCTLVGALVSSAATYLLSNKPKAPSEEKDEDFSDLGEIEFPEDAEVSFYGDSIILEEDGALDEIVNSFLGGEPLSDDGVKLYLEYLNEQYPQVAFLKATSPVDLYYFIPKTENAHLETPDLSRKSTFYILVQVGMIKGMVVYDPSDKKMTIVSVGDRLNQPNYSVKFQTLGTLLLTNLGTQNQNPWEVSSHSLPTGNLADSDIVALEYARCKLDNANFDVSDRKKLRKQIAEALSPPIDLDFE
ncbi:MAG: hypothetical protein K940chlam9_01272 [Chlamydiae bacterium]|nr:hypothetical protein [Chlamydiota bacterium]